MIDKSESSCNNNLILTPVQIEEDSWISVNVKNIRIRQGLITMKTCLLFWLPAKYNASDSGTNFYSMSAKLFFPSSKHIVTPLTLQKCHDYRRQSDKCGLSRILVFLTPFKAQF